MTLKITPLKISGSAVIDSLPFEDHRGRFYRAFCDRDLEDILQTRTIRQINISQTKAVGAVRGLHYQYSSSAEMKLIRCLRGRVWDITVDLRQDSPTFLQWQGIELDSETAKMVVIPEGCAHGFQVLEAGSELLYLHTAHYSPDLEGGLRYDDPQLNISWPLPVTDLSKRDSSYLFLSKDFEGITV